MLTWLGLWCFLDFILLDIGFLMKFLLFFLFLPSLPLMAGDLVRLHTVNYNIVHVDPDEVKMIVRLGPMKHAIYVSEKMKKIVVKDVGPILRSRGKSSL